MNGASTPLPDLVWAHAEDRPDAIALVSVNEGSLTWRGLREQAQRWAAWLGHNGVGAGDPVVSLIPQSLAASTMWMGACVAGALEVCVNAEYRGDWLRHTLNVSGARVVVVPARLVAAVLAACSDTPVTTVLVHDDPGGGVELHSAVRVVRDGPGTINRHPPIRPQPNPGDAACVLFTSGTTGASKGVVLPWAMLQACCESGMEWHDVDEPVYYVPYSPNHLSGRTALYRAALGRGRAVVRESFSTSAFWQDVRGHGCTWALLYAAPTRFLMAHAPSPDDRAHPLQLVLMCPLLKEVDDFKRRFGVDVFSVYGMTEIGNPIVLAPEDARTELAGCGGQPAAGTEVRLVAAGGQPVAVGAVGELLIRAANRDTLSTCYLGMPEETAHAWREGWFHTGDLMRADGEGRLYFVDRRKDMIRRRGENISSMELEAALLTHPAVAEAAVIGVPSDFGDEDVLAAIVVREAMAFDPAALVSHLASLVPRFALPRYVRTVQALPKTPATQRVQKAQLRDQGVATGTWDSQNRP